MPKPLSYRPDTPARPGRWEGTFPWAGRELYMLVAGGETAPDPALEATLWQVVERFDEIARAVEAFAASLLPDGRIPLTSRYGGFFAARNCGFEGGGFYFDGVRVENPERPSLSGVAFVTGEPDGYVSYLAMLDSNQPIEIIAEV